MKKPALILTILLGGLALLLLFWLVLANVPYLGVFKIEAQLGQSTPLVSSLGPEVRTKLVDNYQAVLESPVYFEFRALPWFNQARVIVVYQVVQGHDLVGLGRHTGPGFSYELQAPVAVLENQDGSAKAFFDFDLTQFYQEKNIYRVLLDTTAHQHEVGSELRILAISVILSP